MDGKGAFKISTDGDDHATINNNRVTPGSKEDPFRCYRFGNQLILCFCWVGIVSKHLNLSVIQIID